MQANLTATYEYAPSLFWLITLCCLVSSYTEYLLCTTLSLCNHALSLPPSLLLSILPRSSFPPSFLLLPFLPPSSLPSSLLPPSLLAFILPLSSFPPPSLPPSLPPTLPPVYIHKYASADMHT